MIQNVFGYLLSITCTVAIGRLGAAELAASSLANSIYVVTGLSMVLGLSTGVDVIKVQGRSDYYLIAWEISLTYCVLDWCSHPAEDLFRGFWKL